MLRIIHSRKKCIYAFDTLAHCAVFIGENNKDINFYMVELNSENPHPMCLTDAIRKATSIRMQNIMKEEYWHPTREWKFNEYLGTEMTILEKIERVPAGFFLIQDDYLSDQNVIRRTLQKGEF